MNYLRVLFIKQKKKLPSFLQKIPGADYLRLGIFVASASWLLQGIRYMNWHEAAITFFIDLVLTFILFACGVNIVLSWIIAHTINFSINGQLFAMFTHFGANGVPATFFYQETIKMAKRLSKIKSIECALAFGSLSRGEYKKTSDIDLRLVPAPGELNFWKCSLYALKMRMVAFFAGYPLDLYVFTLHELTRKMRTDEPPVLLAGSRKDLEGIYPSVISLDHFSELFCKKQFVGKK